MQLFPESHRVISSILASFAVEAYSKSYLLSIGIIFIFYNLSLVSLPSTNL